MAENSTNKERLKEITASIEASIQDLFQSERYMDYLRTMSRFHRYSVNNTILIHAQRPDATLVAGFNRWRDQFGRNVKRGEKGIKIIAPTPFKKKVEKEKLDPDTKLPMRDKDGNIIMEEKEIKIPMFKIVSVFDVSQTEGEPLPDIVGTLTGDVQNYEVFMEALRRSSPVPIEMKPLAPDTDGLFSIDKQRISIREGMSEVQTVSAVIHEITHSKLHNYKKDSPDAKDRSTEEVEAESVSFAVCAYYGIQTGENSFGYIANWSQDKELPELRASLETINKTASELIDDIDRHYADICKEQDMQRKADEIEMEPAMAMERLYTVDDNKYLHVQRCDGGVDYTLYDMATKQELDGGQLDMPNIQLSTAALEICKIHNIGSDAPIRLADIKILDELQEAQFEAPAAPNPRYEALVEHFAREDDALWNTGAYPMPDPAITVEDMCAYGYMDGDTMLPLSKERARELFEQDVPVFMLYGDSTESMALDAEDIEKHDGIFGVEREEWDNMRGAVQPAAEQEQKRTDTFLIYQLKHGEAQRNLRFMGMDWLDRQGLAPDISNYDLVYQGELLYAGTRTEQLDGIYQTFNMNRPADFMGHSLSVSDIVVLRRGDEVSSHYVDSVGFRELPDFIKPENYLKNAEIATEDDYGMIDGIINNGPKQPTVAELEAQAKSGQSISLMELADAVHRERAEKKPSVLAQLKSAEQQTEKPHRTAPKKSAEREL